LTHYNAPPGGRNDTNCQQHLLVVSVLIQDIIMYDLNKNRIIHKSTNNW